MRFADFIAPTAPDRFLLDHYGKTPLHIPASQGVLRKPLDWARFNALLRIRSHWTEANLKLIMNSRPVLPEFFIEPVDTNAGQVRRAAAAKVEVFLAMGASLVGDSIEDISPEAQEICAALGHQFSARSGANVYCSFGGVQAFASHCDLHEVFAVQCEGEKSWNIYANRAAAPVETLTGPDAQITIDRLKGPIAMQVRMRPGDILYIPRGFYHDALSSSDASLHVTFSVAPLTGRIIFQLLEELAIGDQAFREYLPAAKDGDGGLLAQRLTELSERLSDLLTGDEFLAELTRRQLQLIEPVHSFHLPERPTLDTFARSDIPAELIKEPGGATLRSTGRAIPVGTLEAVAEWLLSRPAFSTQELIARFRHIEEGRLRGLVGQMREVNLFFPYDAEV